LPASGNVLVNDYQGDAPATVTSHTDPSNGSVTIDAAGDFTYTPDPLYDGIDSFTYTITDADGDTSSATVTITVIGPPVVVFSDSFENGLGNWTQDQNDWYTRDRRATDGNYSAEADGPSSDAELVSPLIDLAGRPNALITFSWRIETTFDTGEYLAMDVSVDGGPWQEHGKLRGNVDQEGVTHDVQIEITQATNVRLRFRATTSNSNEDGNLDYVVVTATSSP
jgi:VCBS repeat-containing protein